MQAGVENQLLLLLMGECQSWSSHERRSAAPKQRIYTKKDIWCDPSCSWRCSPPAAAGW